MPAQLGCWDAPESDLARALQGPVCAALTAELGVIRVTGTGAVPFLQGQLTNDVAHLDEVQVQLNGYCTAKGRLLAVFDHWRSGEDVLLQLPASLTAALIKRLSMFVLRAPAKLLDASAEWTTQALLGPGSADLVRAAFGAVPEAGRSADGGGVRITHLPDGTRVRERFVLRAPAALAEPVAAALRGAQPVASGAWWWSQIDAAMPTVWPATQEAFVPQMINLEVLGGVDFKKGCYPGQEVVARSQYRGRLRRRMALAHADAAPAAAGTDVYMDGEAEPVGSVVMAAAAPGGGIDLLFERALDRGGDRPTLRLADPAGPVLAQRDLPYAIVDVTA